MITEGMSAQAGISHVMRECVFCSSVFRITNHLSINGSDIAHLLSFKMFRSSFQWFSALLNAIYVT